MQKLFDEVGSLDKRCYEKFALTEDILMEHASNGIASYIRKKFKKGSKVTIASGSRNNGADGLACARLLHGDYDVNIFYVKAPSSDMALLQEKRIKALKVKTTLELKDCDVLVDAVMGTGFRGEFSDELKVLMQKLNSIKAFKIACDIPSGIKKNGECAEGSFVADVTLTMGALKKGMFLDEAKEFTGKIKVLNLGVSRDNYETDSNWNLLDMSDLTLPFRDKKNLHKGDFGHLAVACGDKSGASKMSALSALRFGCGLVTLVGFKDEIVPNDLMYAHELPQNTTAFALGMGLGDGFSDLELDRFLDNKLPLIVDADIFSKDIILKILKRKNIVLTPHPKEFVSLLKLTNIADISVKKLQKNRFKYVEKFCALFPDATLVLKGANVIIAQNKNFFINPHGDAKLAKGGSGDILSGLIGSLVAQNYSPLDSAKNASLAHTKLAKLYKGANFSLTPSDLIKQISNL